MAKQKKSKIPEPTKIVKVVPKDLQDQMGAVEAIATAFNVLDKGSFPHSYHNAVKASLSFLAKLHEQTVAVALKHPQAHMVPELKSEIEKEMKDGKAKEIDSKSHDLGTEYANELSPAVN